ncbi:purine-nucleoside phosphorylase [Agarilytica rhodophyticola]|uniref:purine-nucleoside phosphorylase n=1 Tax=Agarilytica rhodophyticola TaxID=1737490 RepID=UPI000B3421A0|nr:purine nucleoside permease [Agarilytica rhodophyticola]
MCKNFGLLITLLILTHAFPLTYATSATAPATQTKIESEKIAVKAVVVTMFEYGKITGDKPGEFQFWVERGKLDIEHEFPLGEYPLRMNKEGVLAICLGGGIANATASIMALGLDPRFDLSKAYWLVAGIAGGDPEDISLGSAAWASHVVDGDLVYEIDAREIPSQWPYGLIPLGAKKPAQTPEDIYTGWTLDTVSFQLNSDLAKWAYKATKDITLPDSPGIKKYRALFSSYPNAQKPPFITLGETLSSSTYWHGKHMNQWANDWVKLYAGKDANFMTTNMEDSGTLTALSRLARQNIIDYKRIMILRTVSNYSMAPKDKPTSWSVTAPYADEGRPALETAYTIGSSIIKKIVTNWNTYQSEVPGN